MKHWARLLTIITTLFWAANSSHALQPTEDILDRQCRSSESFIDNLHKQTKQSKKLHTKMVEIYDHYLKLLESCKDSARLHKSALQLAQTLTNRDIEYDIEQQLLGGNDFNNIMLFFEGLSSNLYTGWKRHDHACGSPEVSAMMKVNRLANLFSQIGMRKKCPDCEKLFHKVDARMEKVYICEESVLWYDE